MTSHLQVFLVLLVSLIVRSTDAQACSCSPLIYKWKLDFTQSCPPPGLSLGIGDGKGITSVECDVTMGNPEDPVDLDPKNVTYYQIIELDEKLAPVKVNSETDLGLLDGERMSFVSVTASETELVTGGIQASVYALNAAGNEIRLTWIVRYSNLCEAKPYEVGDSIGWMVYNNESIPARDETCTLASTNPTAFPTASPTNKPSIIASSTPTEISSASPSGLSSPAPSRLGSQTPTIAPSPEPSSAGSQTPTIVSSPEPSSIGSQTPTIASSSVPSRRLRTQPPTLKKTDKPTVVLSPPSRPTFDAPSTPVSSTDKPTKSLTSPPTLSNTTSKLTAKPTKNPSQGPTYSPSRDRTTTYGNGVKGSKSQKSKSPKSGKKGKKSKAAKLDRMNMVGPL
eukprot:CAMPEP_0194115890 /NCGR_PEP_ID=MMETSP0150-20130528/24766_1 /TAXON_ID=122233 /ORGANISM="Chaetoceros debilis, Strain MM31A-1" /LENGTH=394 /DNA_ID=CAMNT_0038806463 /DNA_START=304 /DNA_END=1488 /DNA_ORIENTATION=-